MGLPATEVTQTVDTTHIPSRPCVQGSSVPLHLRGEEASLTDGVGLVALRRLWHVLNLGAWLRTRTVGLPGLYRPALMVEVWTALLVYGGGWLDELTWHLVRMRYNPKKPGRPSHHPLVAFLMETGDLVGLRWRPGSANTATGAEEWIPGLVERLREAEPVYSAAGELWGFRLVALQGRRP